MIQDGRFRIALLAAWADRCAWCRAHLTVSDMQVDHLLPKTLAGELRIEVLKMHGLPLSYDLEGAHNLVPACRRCNRFKGDSIPPDTPIISLFLQKTARLAKGIGEAVVKLATKSSVDKALAQLNSVLGLDLSEADLLKLAEVSREAQPAIVEATGRAVALHPALGLPIGPGGWRLDRRVGDVWVLADESGKVGYSAEASGYQCPNCGVHGPWRGAQCLTCGRFDEG